ncbi:hypothetical protein U724_05990 [Pseudomonas chlororaphis subsp. aurantiaca PB-St2]|nr:hypothetical protein U724_05990 [Pseudomonas chlororaphis subsp. aurantiaca PB-St2]
MHQGRETIQAGLPKGKTGLQGLERHAVADMAEHCVIEVETQGVGRAVPGPVQPEDLEAFGARQARMRSVVFAVGNPRIGASQLFME